MLSFLGLLSCNEGNDPGVDVELIGNWRLIEILGDPGDGSGVFTPVDSNKIITFEEGGTISSNGDLCDMSMNTNTPTTGTYSETDMTFNSSDCTNPGFNYTFEQTGNTIIIDYPCIEPCRAKFRKQ